MNQEIRARLRWIELYEQTHNAGLVCRKCGISRPTLRLWTRRYKEHGLAGLQNQSRRPNTSPNQKVFVQEEQWILQLRQRRLGNRRIQNELQRQHKCSLARATIQKVLLKQGVEPLSKNRRARRTKQRYERPVPGERIQMGTCRIAAGRYQYTAVDDCTRIRVLALYARRSAANSLLFLERVIEEMPFPIQRIQTDRGREFFAYAFQERLMEYGIKFRPIKPRSPHLNGKVERSQKTDWEEFYSITDLSSSDLENRLEGWQDYYNQFRPHGSLQGKTPWERWWELAPKTPLYEEVEAMYDASQERLQHQDYRVDLQLRKVKGSL